MKKLFSMLLCGAMLLSFSACEKSELGNTTGVTDNHAWVDLGLPSGTLWATCNVGAEKPEEYGDYFSWGEIKQQENYSPDTCKYGSKAGELTKYCTHSKYGKDGFVDNKTVLEAADDAATVNWGKKWCMPVKAQIDELRAECTWEWTTDYNKTGVAGFIITGSNDKSIFIPAAGSQLHTEVHGAGVVGGYWSASLESENPLDAYGIGFESDESYWDNGRRYNGLCVRPVRTGSTINGGTDDDTPNDSTSNDDPLSGTRAFEVIVGANDKEMGYVSISGSGPYAKGAEITISATAYDGYQFVSWDDYNTDNPRKIVIEDDVYLMAIFAKEVNGHACVDLGLPSGTLWAACNVGANSPREYGDYFAWGETEPKSYYDGSAEGEYKWGIINSSDYPNFGLTKYNKTDNKTILDAADDAATVNWGGNWRTPTQSEIEELVYHCNWEWIDNYNGTMISGSIVTGYNGNSIFLPAVGFRFQKKLYDAGNIGTYWSSSLDESYVGYVYMLSTSSNHHYCSTSARHGGRSVRPVCSSH